MYRSEQDLSKSPRGQGIRKYLNDRGMRILAALDEVSGRLNSTPARVALAWLMNRPTVTAPLVSATSVAQWQDLLPAIDLDLDSASTALLSAASQPL
jgi:aryl-alcohol dehydrogenase-like predicted oxidoreductase